MASSLIVICGALFWILVGTATLLGVALARLPEAPSAELVLLLATTYFVAAHCLAISRVVRLETSPARAVVPGTLLGALLVIPFVPLAGLESPDPHRWLELTTWTVTVTALAAAFTVAPIGRTAMILRRGLRELGGEARRIADEVAARAGLRTYSFRVSSSGPSTLGIPGSRSGVITLDAMLTDVLAPPEFEALIAREAYLVRSGGRSIVLAVAPLLVTLDNVLLAAALPRLDAATLAVLGLATGVLVSQMLELAADRFATRATDATATLRMLETLRVKLPRALALAPFEESWKELFLAHPPLRIRSASIRRELRPLALWSLAWAAVLATILAGSVAWALGAGDAGDFGPIALAPHFVFAFGFATVQIALTLVRDGDGSRQGGAGSHPRHTIVTLSKLAGSLAVLVAITRAMSRPLGVPVGAASWSISALAAIVALYLAASSRKSIAHFREEFERMLRDIRSTLRNAPPEEALARLDSLSDSSQSHGLPVLRSSLLARLGRLDEAATYLQEALAQKPSNFVKLQLAVVELRRDEVETANRLINEVIGSPSDDKWALAEKWALSLAVEARCELGDLTGAAEACERLGTAERVGSSNVHALRALVALERGDAAEAWEREVGRALELDPEDPFVLLIAARARSVEGNSTAAREFLERSRQRLQERQDAGTRTYHERLAARWGLA